MRAKVAGLTVEELEGVYRELPAREARQEEHQLVSVALGLEYGAKLREQLKARSCKVLVAVHNARVDSSGRYKPAAGEPAELVSKWCDVAERLLEERHGVDFYELWETRGLNVPGSEDTSAYSSHIGAVIASRCDVLRCEHRA